MGSHYAGLYAAYGTALLCWWLVDTIARRTPSLTSPWPGRPCHFEHPWREFGLAVAACIGVIAIGQLWTRDLMLARDNPLTEALNQIVIFLPLVLLPLVRRQGTATMLLPAGQTGVRLALGIMFALAALSAYSLARDAVPAPWTMLTRMVHIDHLDEAVQVFCEDIAIGILVVRLKACIRIRWAVVAVAALFVAGHVPAMFNQELVAADLAARAADFGLGLVVLGTIVRSGDVLWFWPVHLTMDLTQFESVTAMN